MTTPVREVNRPDRAAFRPDIEGLRAVAVALVLIYHAGVGQLPGGFVGVDVFFVISGFLITGLLVRELESSGRVALGRFYARRAKRLLPAAGVVLLVSAALTWWTASVVEWRAFGLDIVSSALYVVNWRLAARSVDYLAEDVAPSPVQHYWSLAVEEQFYIVWPLLMMVAAWWLHRRRGARPRAVLTLGIALIAVPSFVFSVAHTQSSPSTAFFVSTTRLWELAVGAMVAIGAAWWARIPRTVAILIGWCGLGAIVASGLVMSATTPWPGHHALLPTLGAAAVIIAGAASGGVGTSALLAWRPAVWVGGLSYSLYLWHWPLVVAATAWWGDLTAAAGLAVVAASAVPAYLSHRFIENPIRFSSRVGRSHRLALSIGGNFTLVGVVAGLVLALAVPPVPASPPDSPEAGTGAAGGAVLEHGGAASAAGGDGSVESLSNVEWFVPAATAAFEDVPAAYADGCQVHADSAAPIRCGYGDLESEVVVAVVGDSKILQWQSALESIAETEGWHVVSYTKSGCGFHTAVQALDGAVYATCTEWNAAVRSALEQLQPDLVLTSQWAGEALSDPGDPTSETREAMVDGLVDAWTGLTEQGIGVAVVVDNPDPQQEVYECVAENPQNLTVCSFDRDTGVEASSAPTQLSAAERVPAVARIDLRDHICPAAQCVPVIGNVLIWRQSSHITDTYARTLTDALAQELVPVVEQSS